MGEYADELGDLTFVQVYHCRWRPSDGVSDDRA